MCIRDRGKANNSNNHNKRRRKFKKLSFEDAEPLNENDALSHRGDLRNEQKELTSLGKIGDKRREGGGGDDQQQRQQQKQQERQEQEKEILDVLRRKV